jgi:hypothetical protein
LAHKKTFYTLAWCPPLERGIHVADGVQIVRPDDHVVEGNAHPLLALYLLQAGQLAVPLHQTKNWKSIETPKLAILEIHHKPFLDKWSKKHNMFL